MTSKHPSLAVAMAQLNIFLMMVAIAAAMPAADIGTSRAKKQQARSSKKSDRRRLPHRLRKK